MVALTQGGLMNEPVLRDVQCLDSRGLHRMAWSPLPERGVKQFWEFSADQGATWKTIHIGTYARRR